MDDMKERLKTCSEGCFEKYEAWDAKKGTDTREALQEAIHDLRKVASRLEIEIALSEREKRSDNPIPIPAHRSNSKSKGAVESILPDNGSTQEKRSVNKEGGRRPQRSRRPAPKRNDG